MTKITLELDINTGLHYNTTDTITLSSDCKHVLVAEYSLNPLVSIAIKDDDPPCCLVIRPARTTITDRKLGTLYKVSFGDMRIKDTESEIESFDLEEGDIFHFSEFNKNGIKTTTLKVIQIT